MSRPPWFLLSSGCTADNGLEVRAPHGTLVELEAGGRWTASAQADPGFGASGPAIAHVGLGRPPRSSG